MFKTEKGKFFLILFFITLLSLLSKLLFLEVRPLHNDEAVNHYFVRKVTNLGYFPYSHKNYHGPSYFYFLTLLKYMFGDTIQALRLGAVIPGILLIPSLILLLDIKSKNYILVTSVLLAISTSLHYISRYSIHETLFILFTLAFALSLLNYIYKKSKKYIYIGGIALAGLISTKETFIITVFCVGLAFIVILIIELLKRKKLYYNFDKSILESLLSHKYSLLYSVVFSIILIIACYTAFFTWFEGIYEFTKGVPQWIDRNDSDKGHFKPSLYYTSILIGPWFGKITDYLGFTKDFFNSRWNHDLMEPSFLILFGLPFAFFRLFKEKSLFERKNYFFIFNFVWFLSILIVYSSLNYKTSWLIINITLPGVLLIYDILQILFKNKFTVNIILTVMFPLSLGYSIYYNYIDSYKDNPLAYVHTQDGLIDLVKDLSSYNKEGPGSKFIVVIGGGYWPLPFYLNKKEYRTSYSKKGISSNRMQGYDVIIVKKKNKLFKILDKNQAWNKKYYVFNEANKFYGFFRK